MTEIIFLAVGFLACANGANDNFKGVASLFGSGACGYRAAISWATIATLAGSLTALSVSQALLQKFSGAGLVPAALAASPSFVLTVGASCWRRRPSPSAVCSTPKKLRPR